MQETILKNGRQYRSHPVYIDSIDFQVATLKRPKLLSCLTASLQNTIGSVSSLENVQYYWAFIGEHWIWRYDEYAHFDLFCLN